MVRSRPAAGTTSVAKIRTDIQVLRGVAILTVLFYHSKIGVFSAGYLGVDVFFVISGFLITSLIRDGIEAGNFTLTTFYLRRAKRLLPAAYVTFLLTVPAAPFFLTRLEMADFFHQVLGAVTFTANLVLWQQSGYFEGVAELKPFLHTWSLSIEEQYYLVLPAMLLCVPRRWWLRAACAVALLSLVLALIFSGSAGAFYLLPCRAWELMMGSVGALLLSNERITSCVRVAFWPALAMLVVLPIAGLKKAGVDYGAVLICLATLLIILRRHPLLATGWVVSGLGKVGNGSYSLYLVHWPLLAFFHNAWVSGSTAEALTLRLGLIAGSCVLAYLLHRFVEKPFHHAVLKRPTRFVMGLSAASVGIVVIATGVAKGPDRSSDYAFLRRANYGFSSECEFPADFAPLPACRNSDTPELLVWGDSYAMHLVPGLIEGSERAPLTVQATQSVCGPLLGLAYVGDNEYDRNWAERCISFNDSVVRYLTETDSVKTVVLSSPFVQFLYPGRLLKRDEQAGFHLVESGVSEALAGLKRTVDTVRAAGKKVVIIAPPPAAGFDVGRCLERLESGLLTYSAGGRCLINQQARATYQGPVLQLLDKVPAYAKANVISFDSVLCDAEYCQTMMDGVFLYRDDGHFSHAGSRSVAGKMHLVRKIEQLAH